jgi:hypothetical protein
MEHGTRKSGTWKSEQRNPEPGTRNPEKRNLEKRTAEPGTQNLESSYRLTVRAGCISAGLSHSRGKQLAGFRDPLLQRFSQAPHQLTTPASRFQVPGSAFALAGSRFRVPGSALCLAGPASGSDDLSGCHNAKYLLVFRQFLDEILHVGKLTPTVQLDCFLARPTYRAGDAVKLMD